MYRPDITAPVDWAYHTNLLTYLLTATDMFGTEFLYPAPFCNFRSFYKLQMVPRGHDPVAAFVDDPCRFLDPHLNRGFQYGEMRMGDSSTLYIACGHLPQAGHLPNGQFLSRVKNNTVEHMRSDRTTSSV